MNKYRYTVEINEGKNKRISECNDLKAAKIVCLKNGDCHSYITDNETGELLFLNAPASR